MIPLLILIAGVWIIFSSQKAKTAGEMLGSVLLGLFMLAAPVAVLVFGTRVFDFLISPPDAPDPHPEPAPTLDPTTYQPPDLDAMLNDLRASVVHWVGSAVPYVAWGLVGVVLVHVLVMAAPPLATAAHRRVRVYQFRHRHTPEEIAEVEARFIAKRGGRPEVMKRCVECGRNEWPACRCTLVRERYPMTTPVEVPEPLGAPWGTRPWGQHSDYTAPAAAPERRSRIAVATREIMLKRGAVAATNAETSCSNCGTPKRIDPTAQARARYRGKA